MKAEMQDQEMLLLIDENEVMYAIPREVVESYRVKEEQKVDLEKLLGDDVSGYTMYESYVNEQLAAMRSAEKLEKAEAARQVRAAFQEESGEKAEDVKLGLRLVGRFVSALGLMGLRIGK